MEGVEVDVLVELGKGAAPPSLSNQRHSDQVRDCGWVVAYDLIQSTGKPK